MFTNCYNSGQGSGQVLMICPDYFFAEVGDVETYFAHTIHFRESVPPIVNLFKRSVPVVIEIGLIIRIANGAFVIIKVAANVTICH